jgi:hypothetical protein
LTIPEIASSHTSELVGRGSISIRRCAAVLRVVLPLCWPVGPADAARTTRLPNTTRASGATNSSNAAHSTNPTHSANTPNASNTAHSANTTDAAARPANVAVPDEVVVVIYVDVVVAPSGPITPSSAPEGAHSYANAKRNRQSRSIVSGIIIWIGIGVDRRAPHVNRVITRHVDNLRVGLLNDHHALLLDYLGFDLDLLGGA